MGLVGPNGQPLVQDGPSGKSITIHETHDEWEARLGSGI
jgi:hypothetical protein